MDPEEAMAGDRSNDWRTPVGGSRHIRSHSRSPAAGALRSAGWCLNTGGKPLCWALLIVFTTQGQSLEFCGLPFWSTASLAPQTWNLERHQLFVGSLGAETLQSIDLVVEGKVKTSNQFPPGLLLRQGLGILCKHNPHS